MDFDFSISKSGRLLSLPNISFHLHYIVIVKNPTNAERTLQNTVLFVLFVSKQLSNTVSHSHASLRDVGNGFI